MNDCGERGEVEVCAHSRSWRIGVKVGGEGLRFVHSCVYDTSLTDHSQWGLPLLLSEPLLESKGQLILS